MLNGAGQQVNRQVNLGAKLLVQRLKGRVGQQHGIHFFVELGALLFLLGNLAVWEVLVDKRFPLREFFIAPIETQVNRKPHRPTHVVTGDRIMRQRKGVGPMVVMPVDIVKQTADMFTQGVIQNKDRVAFRQAHTFGLGQEIG
jgi:hypothetical protein